MPDDVLTAEVPPVALIPDVDVIVRDPDHPENAVRWEVTKKEVLFDRVVVIEYLAEDEREGRHSFDDPNERVVVEIHAQEVAA
jgi:hypothetical protein